MQQETITMVVTKSEVEGEPIISGTSITVAEILNKLTEGWCLGDIMETYSFPTDKPILNAVAYTELLPFQHPLANKLKQYREHLKQKVSAILTELKQCFEVLYGEQLIQIVLFGSQARGDANPGSDIDVLVVLKDPVDFEVENSLPSKVLAELSLRHTEVINCIFMNDFDFQHSQEPLLRNIRQEGVFI